MHFVRVVTMVGLLAAVSGCATLGYPLPKCDGYAKRPLNRSMWDWDAGKAQGYQQRQSSLAGGIATALAFADQSDEATATVTFAGFDEAGSHTACRAG